MTIKNVSASVRGRFRQRNTPTPEKQPIALSDQFAQQKQSQWRAFIKRGRLQKIDLEEIIDNLRIFLNPLLTAIRNNESFNKQWKAGGTWKDKSTIDQ